jgi:hypothetical protein
LLPRRSGGPLLAAVASDGAGSVPRAAEGARLACAAVLERVSAEAEERLVRPRGRGLRGLASFGREAALDLVLAARRAIEGAARSEGRDLGEFACTLLVALADRTSAAFAQVGDGAIVYRAASGRYVPGLWPQGGEYANCTFFLTDEAVADRVAWATTGRVDELALLTDGLQSLALRFASREAHGPFFEPMFERLRGERRPETLEGPLRAFLGSAAVNQRTDDDKTLVLATRIPGRRRSRG